MMTIVQKKFILPLVFLLGSATALPALADYEGLITLVVNDGLVVSDVEPLKVNDITYLSLSAVSKALGASVKWDNETKMATVQRDNVTLKFYLNQRYYLKNNQKLALNVPVKLYDNRILLPVRVIAEAFGEKVYWNEALQEVSIGQDNSSPANFRPGFTEKIFTKYSIDSQDQRSFVGTWGQSASTPGLAMDTTLFIHHNIDGGFKVYKLLQLKNSPGEELLIGKGIPKGADRLHVMYDLRTYYTASGYERGYHEITQDYRMGEDKALHLVDQYVLLNGKRLKAFNPTDVVFDREPFYRYGTDGGENTPIPAPAQQLGAFSDSEPKG